MLSHCYDNLTLLCPESSYRVNWKLYLENARKDNKVQALERVEIDGDRLATARGQSALRLALFTYGPVNTHRRLLGNLHHRTQL